MRTKKQLREEAIERLKLLQETDGIKCNNFAHEIVKAATCAHYSYDNAIDVLIDLLADDDSNDTLEPNKVVSCDADTSNDNDLDLEQDSQEKLKADVSTWIANEMGILAKCSTEDAVVLQQAVFEWLDRQAAITERDMECKCELCGDAQDRIVFSLSQERDKFFRSTEYEKGKQTVAKEERNQYKDAAEFAKQRQIELEAETSELLEKIVALETERDQLNSTLAEAWNDKAGAIIERDLLREKCENQRKELRRFNDLCNTIHCFTDENNELRIGSISEYYKATVNTKASNNSLRQVNKELRRKYGELCQCVEDMLWHRAIDQMSADVRVEVAEHLETLGCPVDPV